mmetsp:Transcript_20835/g.43489  ORF Transcript_20835/g.43489 Transcript_20835/m.43489 type:complete len:296 (-) Transcript_20835:470-1357(-)
MFSRKASTSCDCTGVAGTAATGSRDGSAGMSFRTFSNFPLLAASRMALLTFAPLSDFSATFTGTAASLAPAAPDAAVFLDDISFKTSGSLPESLASISRPRSSDRTCSSSAEGAAGGISLTICESTSLTLPISLASARTSFSFIFTFITSVSSACTWDSVAIASRTSAILPDSLASSRASLNWTFSSSASLDVVPAWEMPRWAAISSRICFIFPDSLASNNASRNSPCTFWVFCSPEISSSTVFIAPESLAPWRTCRISVFSRRMSSNSFWFMAILRAASRSPDFADCSSRPWMR